VHQPSDEALRMAVGPGSGEVAKQRLQGDADLDSFFQDDDYGLLPSPSRK